MIPAAARPVEHQRPAAGRRDRPRGRRAEPGRPAGHQHCPQCDVSHPASAALVVAGTSPVAGLDQAGSSSGRPGRAGPRPDRPSRRAARPRAGRRDRRSRRPWPRRRGAAGPAPPRGVLVEDDDGVDALQRLAAPGPVRARGTSGRPGPLSRRTEASELRHTTRQSPSPRAARSVAHVARRAAGRSSRRWRPRCRRRPGTAATDRAASAPAPRRLDAGLGDRGGPGRGARRRAATNAAAAATAAVTASPGTAPSRERRRPRRGERVAGAARVAAGDGRRRHDQRRAVGPASSSAPRAPRVTATAAGPPARASAGRPRGADGGEPSPAPASAPGERGASAAFGVTSRAPGTGSAPRGCGSQTTGTDRARSASAARSAGPRRQPAAVVGRPARRRPSRTAASSPPAAPAARRGRLAASSRSSDWPAARTRSLTGVPPAAGRRPPGRRPRRAARAAGGRRVVARAR